MPVITQRDRSRLAALIAIVKPANSLAARIESLADEERAKYERWEARYHRWIEKIRAQCPEDEDSDAYLYAHYLERDTSPKLRRDIDEALFGKMPVISFGATAEEAMRLYLNYMETGR